VTAYSAVFLLHSAQETIELGRIIGSQLQEGDLLALIGELGTGKTTFTQGIALGLGVDPACYVTSPTFTLINEYPARRPLYHIDLYRLQSVSDIEELGLQEYLESNGVTVIEWAERLAEGALPEVAVRVFLDYVDTGSRRLTFIPTGRKGVMRLRSWLQDETLRSRFTPEIHAEEEEPWL
jgi:tRNA threonylcarbamoyladenosine biosynthesis protein TsaE